MANSTLLDEVINQYKEKTTKGRMKMEESESRPLTRARVASIGDGVPEGIVKTASQEEQTKNSIETASAKPRRTRKPRVAPDAAQKTAQKSPDLPKKPHRRQEKLELKMATFAKFGGTAYEVSMLCGLEIPGYPLLDGEKLALVRLTPIM